MAVGFEFQTGVKVWQISAKSEKKICECKTYAERMAEINKVTAGRQEDAFDTAAGDLKYFPKGHVLHKVGFARWTAVTDGNELEFVTEPVQLGLGTTSDKVTYKDDLKRQFRSLHDYVRSLDQTREEVNKRRLNEQIKAFSIWVCRRDSPAVFRQYPPFIMQFMRMSIYDYRDDPVAGFAQITGGVRLTRLRKLFKSLIASQDKANGSAATFLGGRDAEAYARVLSRTVEKLKTRQIKDSNWPDHDPSAALRGLVTLIALYLQKGVKSGGKNQINVVKNLFFVMARTDFGSMFASIGANSRRGKEEIDHYKAHPDQWVDFICKDVMKLVMEDPNGLDPNGRVIEHDVTDYGELDQPINIPVTRRDWLRAMVLTHEDKLSPGAYDPNAPAAPPNWWTDAHGESRLRGTGQLGSAVDTITLNGFVRDAPIFEFRGPGNANNTIPYHQWSAYAKSAYKFLNALNVQQKSEDIDESMFS